MKWSISHLNSKCPNSTWPSLNQNSERKSNSWTIYIYMYTIPYSEHETLEVGNKPFFFKLSFSSSSCHTDKELDLTKKKLHCKIFVPTTNKKVHRIHRDCLFKRNFIVEIKQDASMQARLTFIIIYMNIYIWCMSKHGHEATWSVTGRCILTEMSWDCSVSNIAPWNEWTTAGEADKIEPI